MNEDAITELVEREVERRLDKRLGKVTKEFERRLAEVRAVKPPALNAGKLGEALADSSITLIRAKTKGFEDRLAKLEAKGKTR